MQFLKFVRLPLIFLLLMQTNLLFGVHKIKITPPLEKTNETTQLEHNHTTEKTIIFKGKKKKVSPKKAKKKQRKEGGKLGALPIISVIFGALSCIPLSGIFAIPISLAISIIGLIKVKNGKLPKKAKWFFLAALIVTGLSLIIHGIFYATFSL